MTGIDPPAQAFEGLRRPRDGRMLTGAAAALAFHLGFDITLLRIAFVAFSFVGGIGIPIYLAAWLLIPEEGCDLSIAGAVLTEGRLPRP